MDSMSDSGSVERVRCLSLLSTSANPLPGFMMVITEWELQLLGLRLNPLPNCVDMPASSDNFAISCTVISDMRLVADWFDAFSCVFIPVCYCMFE